MDSSGQGRADLLDARRRALSDPLRLRMRESVTTRPKTVKQIAEDLSVLPNRLYYHLRILESAKLLEVVGTTSEGRMTERLYGPAGGNFGSELAGEEPAEKAVFFASLLEATKAELTSIVLSDSAAQNASPHASLFRGLVVATREDIAEFWNELSGLIETYNAKARERPETQEPERTNRPLHTHTLTVALYEQPGRTDTASV